MSGDTTNSEDLVRYAFASDHVVVVTLNRPEKRNAINAAMASALESCVQRSEADPNVRVVLLTSASPVFCAGADLGEVAAGRSAGIITADGGFAGLAYAKRRKPWIAVVEGSAVAGGFELCLACDMIVAASSAIFGVPEVKRGLLAGAGAAHRLAQRIPRNIAIEMIASGDPIDAERGFALGLVNRIATPGAALAVARTLADAIAANAPLAVQCGIDVVNRSAVADDAGGRAISDAVLADLRQSEDYWEGINAFVEKRAPVWKAR